MSVLDFVCTWKTLLQPEREMLSTVSSIYDLFVAIFILPGRKIIQRLCQGEVKWDDPVSCDVRKDLKEWKSYLSILMLLKRVIVRFLFSDWWILKIKSIVMGKVRVAPLKFISIPRLELTAATLSVKISNLIREELQYSIDKTRNISGPTVKWCLDSYRMNQRDSKHIW